MLCKVFIQNWERRLLFKVGEPICYLKLGYKVTVEGLLTRLQYKVVIQNCSRRISNIFVIQGCSLRIDVQGCSKSYGKLVYQLVIQIGIEDSYERWVFQVLFQV